MVAGLEQEATQMFGTISLDDTLAAVLTFGLTTMMTLPIQLSQSTLEKTARGHRVPSL